MSVKWIASLLYMFCCNSHLLPCSLYYSRRMIEKERRRKREKKEKERKRRKRKMRLHKSVRQGHQALVDEYQYVLYLEDSLFFLYQLIILKYRNYQCSVRMDFQAKETYQYFSTSLLFSSSSLWWMIVEISRRNSFKKKGERWRSRKKNHR